MLIIPNSRIILLKNPIEVDYNNELTFNSINDQYNYFYNLPKLECENATYQRKDEVLRFPTGGDSSSGVTFEELLQYNYCMYQNTSFDNKWFYAFIKDITFDNPGMSYITLETDVWQTWMFDVTFKNSFIEREHANVDFPGSNTIPEDLETGEFISNAHIIDDTMDDIANDLTYIVSSSIELYGALVSGKYPMATGQTYNGIFSGTKYYRFDNAGVMQAKLQDVAEKGQIEAINGVFMAPKVLAVRKTTQSQTLFEIEERSGSTNYTNSISKNSTIDGYTPKNKKLLCMLYNYLMVSNNNGNSYVYYYENFNSTNCDFIIKMAITPGCSIRMTPLNYRGNAEADEYSINMGKLPICSFPCDMYTNWLTQNSINVLGFQITTDDLNIASNGIGMIGSAVSLASGDMSGIAGLGNSAVGIANALITKKQHELIPPQARGNLNAGDVTTASNKNNFHFYKMSIREEYAKIIDNYFSLFGYKTNDVKLPNITGRLNWNYVKTIGCNIVGDIPQNDLQKIKDIFNKGITFWHNPNTFLDYSQNNPIV